MVVPDLIRKSIKINLFITQIKGSKLVANVLAK